MIETGQLIQGKIDEDLVSRFSTKEEIDNWYWNAVEELAHGVRLGIGRGRFRFAAQEGINYFMATRALAQAKTAMYERVLDRKPEREGLVGFTQILREYVDN
jgi:hypothetical protein